MSITLLRMTTDQVEMTIKQPIEDTEEKDWESVDLEPASRSISEIHLENALLPSSTVTVASPPKLSQEGPKPLQSPEEFITQHVVTLLQGVAINNSERVKTLSKIMVIVDTFAVEFFEQGTVDTAELISMTVELMALFKHLALLPGEIKRKLVKDIVAAWINAYITDEKEKIRLLMWVHGSDQLIDLMVKQFPNWFKVSNWRKLWRQLKCCSC